MAGKKAGQQDMNYLLGVAGTSGFEKSVPSKLKYYLFELVSITWLLGIFGLSFIAGIEWHKNHLFSAIPVIFFLQTAFAILYSKASYGRSQG